MKKAFNIKVTNPTDDQKQFMTRIGNCMFAFETEMTIELFVSGIVPEIYSFIETNDNVKMRIVNVVN